MSRLQKHRKSQSTSALSMIADGVSHMPGMPAAPEKKREKRASQHPALGRVDEGSSTSSASVVQLPGLSGSGVKSTHGVEEGKRVKSRGRAVSEEDVKGWMNDIVSLRSSDRRRRAALDNLEKALMRCCVHPKRESSEGGLSLTAIISLQVHVPLLSLLVRHAQGLITKHPPIGEELGSVVIELGSMLRLLQGLCLLSRRCKEAAGESHILEILIDLLLLLRTQPSQPLVSSSAQITSPSHPIGYALMELLFNVLVDCPANARNFERLGGLEAVSRVMRGSSVEKVIKMKCAEFLYFYLLPEDFRPPRAVSSSSNTSTSSSSSGESMLYPPSPLSSSTSSIGSGGRVSPSPFPSSSQHMRRIEDLDVPFVPTTPKKKPQPALGFLTPSARRVSGGGVSFTSSTTPSLEPVPASPSDVPSTSTTPATKSTAPDTRRWSVVDSSAERNNAGLGLGLPKSSSVSTRLSNLASGPSSKLKRDVTAIKLDENEGTTKSNFSDPFSDTRSSSSGSSTVVPSRPQSQSSGMSRSSTTNDLASQSARRVSLRRPSKLSGSVNPSPIESSSSSAMLPPPSAVRQSKIRHSRTQSHMSSLAPPLSPPPVPAFSESPFLASRRKSTPPSVIAHSPSINTIPSTTSSSVIPSTPRHDKDKAGLPLPTPAKRAFPAELTRGRIPPSSSSPALSVLAPSRRIPSGRQSVESTPRSGVEKRDVPEKRGNETRSVEEKKEMLSNWLGNVDQLIQGVEKLVAMDGRNE